VYLATSATSLRFSVLQITEGFYAIPGDPGAELF
jgi:hypothetical protein